MVKKPTLPLTLLLAGMTWTALSEVSGSGRQGSFHSFSRQAWNSNGKTCALCHPSGSTDAGNVKTAWSRDRSTRTYTLYRSATLDAIVEQPSAVSRVCLGCHDGTVALNSFGRIRSLQTDSGACLGTDLSNDHPISYVYDTALAYADSGLFDPATQRVPELGGKTVQEAMLVDNRVECTSCHDVHKQKGYSAVSDEHLVISTTRGRLCRACHNK